MSDSKRKLAFNELLGRSRGRLMAISKSYARSDADDLLQEILLQIWRGLKNFKGDSAIDTWSYRVALNTAMTWRRARLNRQRLLPSASSVVDEIPSSDHGVRSFELLEKFMHTLSDADRAVLLVYMEDISGAEMAEIIGISEASFRVRIHRIKKKLSNWKRGDS